MVFEGTLGGTISSGVADSIIGLIWKHGFQPTLEPVQGVRVDCPITRVAEALKDKRMWTNTKTGSLAIVYVSKPRAEKMTKGKKGKVTNTEIPRKLLQLDANNQPVKTTGGRFLLKPKKKGDKPQPISTAEWYRMKHNSSFKNNTYTTMPMKFEWDVLHLDFPFMDELIRKKLNALNVKYNGILEARQNEREVGAGDRGRYQKIVSNLRDQMTPLRDDIVEMLKTRKVGEGLIYMINFRAIQPQKHETLKLGGPQNVQARLECKIHAHESDAQGSPGITVELVWREQGVGGTVIQTGRLEFVQGRFSTSRSKGEIWNVAKKLHPIIKNPTGDSEATPTPGTATWKAQIEASAAWKYLEDWGTVGGDTHNLADGNDSFYTPAGRSAQSAPNGSQPPASNAGTGRNDRQSRTSASGSGSKPRITGHKVESSKAHLTTNVSGGRSPSAVSYATPPAGTGGAHDENRRRSKEGAPPSGSKSRQPATSPSQPSQPATSPSQPSQPATSPSQPSQPATTPSQPSQPATTPSQPQTSPNQPGTGPRVTVGQARVTTGTRVRVETQSPGATQSPAAARSTVPVTESTPGDGAESGLVPNEKIDAGPSKVKPKSKRPKAKPKSKVTFPASSTSEE
jgi:hypothetical protein